MAEFKSGFVAIIGRTNVGKSTLINKLVGEKVAITVNKSQTTRTAIRAIVNRENSQIIFIDTPGVHKPKTKLGETMLETAYEIAEDVDIILFIVDCSKKEITKGDRIILEKIKEGNNIALISDAGTPIISDPGEVIVKEAIKENIEIIPIPGACALINALIASGLNTKEFAFYGFLPLDKKLRNEKRDLNV